MKKYLFFILVFGFLFFSLPVFAYTYTRTPATYNIKNPVSFYLKFSDKWEIGCGGGLPEKKWGVDLINQNGKIYYSDKTISYYDTEETFIFNNLPQGNYLKVKIFCVNLNGDLLPEFKILEESYPILDIPIFKIEGILFSFPTDFASSVFSFSEQFILDLRTALYILIGLTLGMGIIIFILDLFEKRKEK
jgi:hypothetical protein